MVHERLHFGLQVERREQKFEPQRGVATRDPQLQRAVAGDHPIGTLKPHASDGQSVTGRCRTFAPR